VEECSIIKEFMEIKEADRSNSKDVLDAREFKIYFL
jgi:hypothetical protein